MNHCEEQFLSQLCDNMTLTIMTPARAAGQHHGDLSDSWIQSLSVIFFSSNEELGELVLLQGRYKYKYGD
jgi:hypothetical protein